MDNAPRILCGLAIALGIAGCAEMHIKLPSDEATSATRAVGASQAASTISKCHNVQTEIDSDVDTVYARVMSRLHFRTLEERRRFAEIHSSGFFDEGFRHVAQPGAYYRMADLVGWYEASGAREAVWMEVELARSGSHHTKFQGR